VFLLYILNKKANFLFKKTSKLDKANKKRFNRFLLYLSALSFSAIFFSHIDSIMIGSLIANSEYVGYYKAAFTLVFSLSSLFLIGNIVTPVFTQIKKKKLNKVFQNFFRYIIIISFPIIAGIIIFSKYILKLIYGYHYIPAAPVLIILSFLIFEIVITKITSSILLAKEKLKFFTIFTALVSLLNIFLNYFLIKIFLNFSDSLAMLGAALATLFSRYLFMFGTFIFIRKKFNIKPKIKILVQALFSSLVMAAILLGINTYISDMNLLIGFGEVILGAIIYFLTMFLVKGFNKEDIKNSMLIFSK
jgi:O-antigen/teichoic acid export membrane protein